LVAVGSFLGPLALVYLLVFFKSPNPPAAPRREPPLDKLLWRTVFAVGVLLLLLVLVFRATNIRERWLQPVLICAPVLAVAFLRDRFDRARLRWIVRGALTVMLVVAALLPARVLFAERIRREERLNRPYDALAAQLRSTVPEGSLVVTDLRLLGGNLRLNLANRLLVSRDLTDLFHEDNEHWFLAWDATRSEDPPKALLDWAAAVAPAELWSQPQYFTATYKHHRTKQLRLGLLQIK
jgi:hypothetical protein